MRLPRPTDILISFGNADFMNFDEFKNKAGTFNVLRRIDFAGCYYYATATVTFDSLVEADIIKLKNLEMDSKVSPRLSEDQYKILSKILPLAAHEYTHFIDSTSSLWGLNLLAKMNEAYLCSDLLQRDERRFHAAKEFHDYIKRIALPEYYTYKTNAQNTRPWQVTVTNGQLFDSEGKLSDRVVLFQRFANFQGELLVRSPISTASLLEASAMAQQILTHLMLVRRIEGDFGIVEARDFPRRTLDYLYDPKITEYSVCVHLVSNQLGLFDGIAAFAVCAMLTRLVLNFSAEIFDRLLNTKDLMRRVGLPESHKFSDRLRDGLKHRDLGVAFFLLTRCLPKKPGLEPHEIRSVVRVAAKALGLDLSAVHAAAVNEARKIVGNLKETTIGPIRLLSEFGLANMTRIEPNSASIDFTKLHLPQALLGDMTNVRLMGRADSALGALPVDEIFEPLHRGEAWVARFAEGCI